MKFHSCLTPGVLDTLIGASQERCNGLSCRARDGDVGTGDEGGFAHFRFPGTRIDRREMRVSGIFTRPNGAEGCQNF